MFSRITRNAAAAALMGALFVGLAISVFVAYFGRASSAPLAYQEITAGGPLTNIYVGNELSCQLHHAADVDHGTYPNSIVPADCGTLVAVNGTLYAPDFFAHDGTAAMDLGAWTPYTQVSQTAVTGSGTPGDPYTVVTVADAGASGLRITQTDSHVAGTDTFQTDVQVQNTSANTQTVLVYRAARCFLADNNINFGLADPATKRVGCARTPNNSGNGRVLEWSPVTPIDHYMEAFYRTVWAAIGARNNLPDTCQCTTGRTAAAGINWQRTIAPGASVTLSHLTTLSGAMPTPTPTASPVATDTPAATETPTVAPTATHTPPPTSTHTPWPTSTHTPQPTSTHTPLPTSTHTPQPTSTNTPLPTSTHTPPPTSTRTPWPTSTRTPVPTWTTTPSVGTATPVKTKTCTSGSAAMDAQAGSAATCGPQKTRTPETTRTPEATKTAKPTRTPSPTATFTRVPERRCADVNGDGRVTWDDVRAILRRLGKKHVDPKYDLNGDGKVTGRDVFLAVRQVGKRCER
jgi:hypothetical protein